MKKRQTILPAFAALLAATVLMISCTKTHSAADEAFKADAPWQFSFTRSGETTHTNTVATFRASLLHNGTGRLMADGSYSGYYTDTAADWPFPELGWLYPCRTYDAPGADPQDGMALDRAGNLIAWDDPNWFENTDNDSKYALRGPYTNQSINYSLVFTSPAVRMACYLPEGKTDVPDNYRWGFPIDRKTSTWAVSPASNGMPLTATYLNNQYIYKVDPTLLEHRSKLTVKVACGSVSKTDIRAVYFKNVLSSAYYMPMAGRVPNMDTYEQYLLDGNDGTDPAYDPLVSYYTVNNYPAAVGGHAGTEGDKLVVPDGESDIHLVRRPGQTEDFIANGEWANFTDADEWEKGSTDKSLLTAVRDFPILPMDYSVVDGDVYKYEAIMPKLVILTGIDGNVKTTVRLAANFEPMKAYTVYIYVSSAYVQAFLTVSDWTIHRHWTEDPSEDTDKLEVSFGQYKEQPLGLLVTDWRLVRPDDEEGHITNN